MAEQNLPMQDIAELNRILRIEIRCGRRKIKALQKRYKVKSVRKFLRESDKIGKYIFKKYGSKFCGCGDFYPLSEINQHIDHANFKKKSKSLMKELVKSSAVHSSLETAIRDFKAKHGNDQLKRTLERFDKLNVSPVVIPKRAKVVFFPNPIRLAKEYYNEIE